MKSIDEYQTPLHAGHMFVGLYLLVWFVCGSVVTIAMLLD